jgi:hypothetical protein
VLSRRRTFSWVSEVSLPREKKTLKAGEGRAKRVEEESKIEPSVSPESKIKGASKQVTLISDIFESQPPSWLESIMNLTTRALSVGGMSDAVKMSSQLPPFGRLFFLISFKSAMQGPAKTVNSLGLYEPWFMHKMERDEKNAKGAHAPTSTHTK